MTTRAIIKIDALRSVSIEVDGTRVNLGLLLAGVPTGIHPIPADISQAIGGALIAAGAAAAANGAKK